MRSILRTLALALMAVAGCKDALHPADPGAGSEGGTVTDGTPPTAIPTVAASILVRDGSGTTGPFTIDDLEELNIEVRFTSAPPGAHGVRLVMLNPRGKVSADLRGTVVIDGTGQGTYAQTIQVRGTSIERYRQTGNWTFRASFEAGDPLAATDIQVSG
jgi:hypothetical protein